MELSLAGGVSIDLATTSDIADMGKSVVDQMRKDASGCKPKYFSVSHAGVSDATSGLLTLGLGGPNIGFMWDIMGVVTFGSDDHTPVSGATGALYVGSQSAPTLGALRAPGIPIPSYDFLGRNRLWIGQGEQAFINFQGAMSQAFGCTLLIAEWRTIDVMSMGAP